MQTVSMGPQDHEEPHESLAQIPKYDLENWRRYSKLLNDGESVYVTERCTGRTHVTPTAMDVCGAGRDRSGRSSCQAAFGGESLRANHG